MKDKLIGMMVMLLFSPFILAVLLCALPILLAEYAYSRYRKEPKPNIPKTIDIDDVTGKVIAERCLKFITAHLVGANHEIKRSQNNFILKSDSFAGGHVTLSYDVDFRIDITGLNTYEWYIDENHQDIDLYLWIVIGVLRGGVQRTRSRLGRVNYWVWCEELRVWAVIQKEGTSYDGIHFYDTPPQYVKAQFSVL